MYHLLNSTRQCSDQSLSSEPEPETKEASGMVPAEEMSSEPEATYTVIGEPVFPVIDEEPTVILIETLPVPIGTLEEAESKEPAPEADEALPPFPPRRRLSLIPFGWTLAGFLVVVVAVLVGTQVLAWWNTSATVTIVPQTEPISVTQIAHLVTGAADLTHDEVQGRQLANLTISQQQTVATTGHGYRKAQVAQGWIILYNALTIPQTIPAGTLIIGSDGVQITTDTTVTIPAGLFASNGHFWVSAHAVESGPQGNMVAQDIHGPCCRADVLAENPAPFSGGQDAQHYQAVSTQDIEEGAAPLQAILLRQVAAAYQIQLGNDERLVMPVACHAQISADHAPGTEATHTTVTVAEACQGVAYQVSQMRLLSTQALYQQMSKKQKSLFHLDNASLDITISRMYTGEILVKAKGVLMYQWSEQQQQALAAMIAGKSENEANALLLQQPGVSVATISLNGRSTGTLPNTPTLIHFKFFY